MYIYIHVYIYMCVNICVYVNVYNIYIYMYLYLYIYIYIIYIYIYYVNMYSYIWYKEVRLWFSNLKVFDLMLKRNSSSISSSLAFAFARSVLSACPGGRSMATLVHEACSFLMSLPHKKLSLGCVSYFKNAFGLHVFETWNFEINFVNP